VAHGEASHADSKRQVWEKEFAENLSSAVLVGTFTTIGEEASKPDRYEIAKVTKLQDDFWLFQAKYGDKTMPPLPLKVLWAGNTPVITMDDFTIPLLGTFSFRVMIDGDLYVGTWVHDERRGHMIGRIEPAEEQCPDKSS
jgi:hypothetical protein